MIDTFYHRLVGVLGCVHRDYILVLVGRNQPPSQPLCITGALLPLHTQPIMDPISSSFASAISATIKIIEVVYQFQATDEQTSDILNTANHVERNLKEAERLLRKKDAVLDRNDYEWVACAIRDTRDALQSVAKLTEPARVEKMTKNEIGMMTKACWAFKSNPQARDKHAMLNICHQTLMAVITRLHSINLSTVPEILDQGTLLPPPPYDNNMEKLWTWRDQRRNRRRSTTSLRHDNEGAPVFLATNDRQELEVRSLVSESYSTAQSMTDSQRGSSAQEVRSYNTDRHPGHPDASLKPATSHNEAFELPSVLIPPTAPYSLDGWPNASHSSISFPGSVIDLPSANRRSILPVHVSYETAATLGKKFQMFEMSAAPPSPEQKTPQLIEKDISKPRKPIDRSSPSCLLPGNSAQSYVPASTGSDLTLQSWGSAASAQGPHASNAGSELIENLGILSQASFPACRSELEAEAMEEGAPFLAPDRSPGAGARRTERASMDRIWASGACANSSPALGARRPDIGHRVRSTGNRSGSRPKYRGSWLAYQTSLRDSTHGREGAGGT